MCVTVDIVLHAKAFDQRSELFDTLNVPKDTRAICVQSKRFSKCEKELATETFDTNSTVFSVQNENNAILKLLFLSGAIVAVSRTCNEKYSLFYRTLNETCLF